MAHSIPEKVTLTNKHNKPIALGKSRQPYADDFASRDRSTFTKGGKTLDKPIQVYRLWFRFLQLALELEQKKVTLVTYMKRMKYKTPKKDAWGSYRDFYLKPVTAKIKVDRSKYKDWHLTSMKHISFDEWWKGSLKKEVQPHKHLFYPDNSITILNSRDKWDKKPYYKYVRIDNRRRVNDIVADFRSALMEQPRYIQSTTDYQVNGNPNIDTLTNRYNALILTLTTDLQQKEILQSKYIRRTQTRMSIDGSDVQGKKTGVYSGITTESRVMRDLLMPAKIALLSVCDGYFVRNPNKKYI